MRRVFTVELTTREALTVHRMARLAGVTPDRIVQLIYRSSLFDCIVSLSTGQWQFYDEQTRTYVHNRRKQFRQFVEYAGNLLRHAEAVPEQTIQQLTKIAPGQV